MGARPVSSLDGQALEALVELQTHTPRGARDRCPVWQGQRGWSEATVTGSFEPGRGGEDQQRSGASRNDQCCSRSKTHSPYTTRRQTDVVLEKVVKRPDRNDGTSISYHGELCKFSLVRDCFSLLDCPWTIGLAWMGSPGATRGAMGCRLPPPRHTVAGRTQGMPRCDPTALCPTLRNDNASRETSSVLSSRHSPQPRSNCVLLNGLSYDIIIEAVRSNALPGRETQSTG